MNFTLIFGYTFVVKDRKKELFLKKEGIFLRLRNCVYRFINDKGEIIYVGKAKNLKMRMVNHNHLAQECYKERLKTEFVMFKTEDDMDFAERYFIPKYRPKYNVIWSEREISISIPMLDEKTWIEYGRDDYIREQVDFLSTQEIREFYETINEDCELNIETQIEELTDEITKIKEKINVLRQQKAELDKQVEFFINKRRESEEVKTLENKGYGYAIVNKDIMTLKRVSDDGAVNYRDDVRIMCFDTKESRFAYNNQMIVSDYLKQLEEELKVCLNKRLKLILGEEFSELDRYAILQMIKYETFNLNDTLQIKLNEVIGKAFNACVNEIEGNGYYYRSKLMASVYCNLSYCSFTEEKRWIKWIDGEVENQQGELKRTDKIRKKANEIIAQVELLLQKQYGDFEETVIVEDVEYPIIEEKIPQAAIIMRPVGLAS